MAPSAAEVAFHFGRRMTHPSVACRVLAIVVWSRRASGVAECSVGERVTAFYAGQVDRGSGVEVCAPTMAECYFSGGVAAEADRDGLLTIDWDDGDVGHRHVHHTHVRQSSSGDWCSGLAVPELDEDDHWVPPEIPCTILSRLHWEGSREDWNKEAVSALKSELQPDEVIDGFDWHVILRFHDADSCERAFTAINDVLRQCTEPDPESCRTHKYVKAIEYVGDEPETRRRTGRGIHTARTEL